MNYFKFRQNNKANNQIIRDEDRATASGSFTANLDKRPEMARQQEFHQTINNRPAVRQLKAFHEKLNNSPQLKKAAALQAMAGRYGQYGQKPVQKRKNTADASKTTFSNTQPIQRTTWTFTSGSWVKGPQSGVDRWPPPHPRVKAYDGDTYDQNTGNYVLGGEVKGGLHKIAESSKKAFGGQYKGRRPTAAGFTSGTGNQYPHTFPHIGKRAMVESAKYNKNKYSLASVPLRTGILPSVGQVRRLLSDYEQNSGISIPKKRKRELVDEYNKQTKRRRTEKANTRKEDATVRLMEMNPMGTYGHGRAVTADELGGKSEKRANATADLEKMINMTKGGGIPPFETVDFEDFNQPDFFGENAFGFPDDYKEKYFRDIGTVALGEEPSEFELSSEDEYSSDEDESDGSGSEGSDLSDEELSD